eukprot:5659545-Ditylum_brightwellii.AAC.1
MNPKDNSEKITLMVELYFKAIQQMTNFPPKNKDWRMDVTQHFVTHLIPQLKEQMKSDGYVYDSMKNTRKPIDQVSSLQTAYVAANTAEQNLNRLKSLVKQETSGHIM